MSPRRAKGVRDREGEDPATALREHLVDAAEKLISERQVLSITIRDIARAANVSDGVLYNYFADKNDLLVAALVRRHSRVVELLAKVLPEAGSATVEENLNTFTRAAFDMIRETLPMTHELRAEPSLLHRFIEAIHHEPFGPQQIRRPIIDYLSAEQRLGRVARTADPEAATTLLIGATFMLVMNKLMTASAKDNTDRLPAIVSVVMHGLDPT